MQSTAVFESSDAAGEAHVNFLRSILGRTFAAFVPVNQEEAKHYNFESFSLADLEDLLSQFWVPQLVSYVHMEDTLRDLASHRGMTFEKLRVCSVPVGTAQICAAQCWVISSMANGIP
jgi:hypothetical protein